MLSDKIIEIKVESLKNSEYYGELEREINFMFHKIISRVLEENKKLKKENFGLKKMVKNTVFEKGFENFHAHITKNK